MTNKLLGALLIGFAATVLQGCGGNYEYNKDFLDSASRDPDMLQDEPAAPAAPQPVQAPVKAPAPVPPPKNTATNPPPPPPPPPPPAAVPKIDGMPDANRDGCPDEYYSSCEACINAREGDDICLDKRRYFSAIAGRPVECYKHIPDRQYDHRNCRYDHVGYSGTNPNNGRKHFDPNRDCLWAREQVGVEYEYGGGEISNPGGHCSY